MMRWRRVCRRNSGRLDFLGRRESAVASAGWCETCGDSDWWRELGWRSGEIWEGWGPPGVLLRKDVKGNGMSVRNVQGCDSKGVRIFRGRGGSAVSRAIGNAGVAAGEGSSWAAKFTWGGVRGPET